MGKHNKKMKLTFEETADIADVLKEARGTIHSLKAENRAYEKELARRDFEHETEIIRTTMITCFLADPGADWDSHVWNFACRPEIQNADPEVAIQGLAGALADVLKWSWENGVLDKVLGYYADPEYCPVGGAGA